MILCQCLYAQRNLSLYDDPKQFEVVSELKDHTTAKRVALDMLRDRAESAGIQRFWQSGKKKGPPVTFCPPKNTLLEEQGEFKARILFSYYKHPLCYYGPLVGRFLTLMLKTWKALIPGIEMLNTTCLLRFVRRWNKWLQEGEDP